MQDNVKLGKPFIIILKWITVKTDDIHAIVHGKLTQKYQGDEVEAMKAIAKAHENRSLSEFEHALLKFKNGNQPHLLTEIWLE